MMTFQVIFRKARSVPAILILALLAACGSEELPQQGQGRQGGPGGPQIPSVEVVRAQSGSLPLEERLTGRVTARNQTEIYPEVGGPITEIYADNGEFVNEGDPLVQIRDSEYIERYQQAVAGLEIARAQTRQAEANLALLRSQLRRAEELAARQLETTASLENVQSQVAMAEADLDLRVAQQSQARSQAEERRLQLLNTTIRAPVSGSVGQRNAERGQLVSTSTRLFLIGDLQDVRIEISLTERMLNYIREGMTVNLYSENWPGTVLQSRIARISPFLDPSTLRTQAYIEMENPDAMMRSGMFLTVDVLYGESEEAVLIPNSAIYRHPRTGVQGVFVLEQPSPVLEPVVESMDETASVITPPLPVSFVPINVIASGRMASGVAGIQEGDWVVSVGQNLLVGNVTQARARLMDWDRMFQLQRMQSRDLFEILDQHRSARTEG